MKQISFFYLKTWKAFSLTLIEGFSINTTLGIVGETIELNKHLVLHVSELSVDWEQGRDNIRFTFQTKIRITFLLGASWVGGWLRQECHIFLMSSNSHSLVIVFNGTIAEVPYFLQLLKFTMPHHQQHIYFLVWASRKGDQRSVLHFFHFPWEKVRPSPMAHFDHPVG